MLSIKSYEPNCPSPKCTVRIKNKLYHVKAKPNWLPPEVWAKKKDDQFLYRCTYCGLVWFQERAKRPGFDARPIGYYDDPQHPWEFVSLKSEYRIREQNTSRYWHKVESKGGAIHPPMRGGVD